jgi:hypothetical protein
LAPLGVMCYMPPSVEVEEDYAPETQKAERPSCEKTERTEAVVPVCAPVYVRGVVIACDAFTDVTTRRTVELATSALAEAAPAASSKQGRTSAVRSRVRPTIAAATSVPGAVHATAPLAVAIGMRVDERRRPLVMSYSSS